MKLIHYKEDQVTQVTLEPQNIATMLPTTSTHHRVLSNKNQVLTTEDCPLKSLSMVGGGDALGIATVTSYIAGTNERM